MSYSPRLALSFYSILCLVCSVAVYFLPIETKDRGLQVGISCPVFQFNPLLSVMTSSVCRISSRGQSVSFLFPTCPAPFSYYLYPFPSCPISSCASYVSRGLGQNRRDVVCDLVHTGEFWRHVTYSSLVSFS